MLIRSVLPQALLSSAPALALLLTAGTAGAQSPVPEASSIRFQLEPCFLPPSEGGEAVTIAFTIGANGSLAAEPTIVEAGVDAQSEAMVAAGIRAIERCAPFDPAYEGEVIVTFQADVLDRPSHGDTAGPASAAVSGQPPAGSPVPFPADDGFCFVDPRRSDEDEALWDALQPPSARRETVLSIAIDCAILERGLNGDIQTPPEVAIVAHTPEPAGMSETLDEFLARLEAQFEEDNPPDPRFWQEPPIAGSVYTGRDERAVYLANRQLSPDGEVALTISTAYTRIDGETLTFIFVRSDGQDFDRKSARNVGATVERAFAAGAR